MYSIPVDRDDCCKRMPITEIVQERQRCRPIARGEAQTPTDHAGVAETPPDNAGEVETPSDNAGVVYTPFDCAGGAQTPHNCAKEV